MNTMRTLIGILLVILYTSVAVHHYFTAEVVLNDKLILDFVLVVIGIAMILSKAEK